MIKQLTLTTSCLLALASASLGQESNENARDGFKNTRKSVSELNESYGKNPPVAPPPTAPSEAAVARPSAAHSTPRKRLSGGRRVSRPSHPAPRDRASSASLPKLSAPSPPHVYHMRPTVGLGYTLFLKNEVGEYVNVSPSRVFRTGDMLRLLVETKQSGYIYVFHQENGGKAKMLFPDYRIADGSNSIQAHHATFVPARHGFRFKGGPAMETFTLIFSRTPIPGLPIGEALMGINNVPVPDEVFQRILQQPCFCDEDRLRREGRALTSNEGERDVELGLDEPEPDSIFMNRERSKDHIATQIRLVHR